MASSLAQKQQHIEQLAKVLSVIDRRGKDFDSTLWSYKLGDGSGPSNTTFGFDVPMVDDLEIDEKSMSLWIPVADGNRRDGVGDLLDVTGIITERHYKRPLVLFDHGKEISLPLARARAVPHEQDSYTFKIDAVQKKAGLRAYFYTGKEKCDPEMGCKQYDHALWCEQIFDMCAKDMIGAGSIGYQVIEAEHLSPDYRTGTQQGLHLKKILKLEGSLVVLPANMDTVTKYLTGGRLAGKPLNQYTVKSLNPYRLPKRATVVSGYQTKGMSHGPECKCASCVKKYGKNIASKSCGCGSCSKGHACPCGSKGTKSGAKGVKAAEKISSSPVTTTETPPPVQTTESSPVTTETRSRNQPLGLGPVKPQQAQQIQNVQTGIPIRRIQKTPEEIHDDVGRMSRRAAVGTVAGTLLGTAMTGFQDPKDPETIRQNQQQQAIERGQRGENQGGNQGGNREVEQKIRDMKDQRIWRLVHQEGLSKKEAEITQQFEDHLSEINLPKEQLLEYYRLPGMQKLQLARKWAKGQGGKNMSHTDSDYFWDAKSLKDLRSRYRKSAGRFRTLRKSREGSAVVNLSSKDLDNLRTAAQGKGVSVKWMADDGKGIVKVKLSGSDGPIGDLAKQFGKRRGKSLEGVKNVGSVGTLPSGSRSRDSIGRAEDLNMTEMSTERPQEPGALPVLTAKKLTAKNIQKPNPKGNKTMNRQTKAADPLLDETAPKPEDGPGLSSQGMEDETHGLEPDMYSTKGPGDLGGGAEGGGDLGDDEPFGMQVVRRLHADASGLAHEYDGFLKHTEDESTRKLLIETIEDLIEKLEKIEDHVSGHERYKDLADANPLEGTEPEGTEGLENMEGLEGAEGAEGDLGGEGDEELEDDEFEMNPFEDETSASSEEEEEPSPDEALEGMTAEDTGEGAAGSEGGEGEEEPTKEEKALYYKQVKSLRQMYGKNKSVNAEVSFLRRQLKSLGSKNDASTKAKRSYLIKRLNDIQVKNHQPSDDISPSKARQMLKDGTAHGEPLTEKQRGMLGAAAGRKSLEVAPNMNRSTRSTKALERNTERKQLKDWWMEVKSLSTVEAKEAKAYIATRWKSLKDEEEKEKSLVNTKKIDQDEEGPVAKFMKNFTPKHKKSITEAHTFLKSLGAEDADYDDDKRLKSYHLGKELEGALKDITGTEDEVKSLEALAKALLTEECVHVEDPSSNPQAGKVGHEPMQQWEESESVIRGKKDLEGEFGFDHPTDPSSNPQAGKTGKEPMQHWQASESVINGSAPSNLFDNDGKVGNKPSSNPQLKVGKEPMQKWGEGGSLVKYLKSVAGAASFLKSLAYEKVLSLSHRTVAERLAKALGVKALGLDSKEKGESTFVGDRNWLQEEEDEKEHKGMENLDAKGGDNPHVGGMDGEGRTVEPLTGEESAMKGMDAVGELGEKSLMSTTLRQSRTISQMQNSLNDLLSKLG